MQKELRSNDNIWSLSSEKVLIDIDAKTGRIKHVYISSTEYEKPKNYGITREEAINIATLKDSKITKNRKIKNINAEIRIKKMNEQVFLREKFTEEYENDGTLNFNYEKTDENMWQLKKDAVFYETEGRVRKVWVVVIEYEKREKETLPVYSYYVDSTTGEIIGGATWNPLESEKTLRNDPNNVIEK